MKVESVAIIGAGSIGGTIAFGLLALNDPFKEILLVDMSKDIVQAQILDLSDAASCGETIIRGATFKEAGKCDLIILAANTPSIEKEPHDKASSLFTHDTLSRYFFFFFGFHSFLFAINGLFMV
jgi:malate/lactate dehydrogenase